MAATAPATFTSDPATATITACAANTAATATAATTARPAIGEAPMRTRSTRAIACIGAALALLLASCTNAPAPGPAPAPSDVQLDGWQLTLPIADPDSGDADTVNPAKVSPPWLTTADNGGVTFWAPVDGATTKNSSHARTELVQRDTFPAGSEPHTLTASATVTQLPNENPDVILGQIHGAADIKSVAWVMLHYFDGAIKVVVKQAQSGSASQDYVLADSVPLNTPFTFRLSDNGNGTLTFGLDAAGQTKTATAPVPPAFAKATVRFQVGAYQQAESTDGAAADDGARVTFTKIATDDKSAPVAAQPSS
jgi:Alginate lyase